MTSKPPDPPKPTSPPKPTDPIKPTDLPKSTDPIKPIDSPKPPDPMKSFVGVMSLTLLLEVIVLLLALPVVAKLGGGLATWQGVLAGVVAVALLVMCAFVKRPWGKWVAAGLQVVLLACWFAMTALGVVGLVFGLVWTALLWMRHDVARRMAEGRLPSQQTEPSQQIEPSQQAEPS